MLRNTTYNHHSSATESRLAGTKSKSIFQDPFGNIIFLKRMLTGLIGWASYRRLNISNNIQIEGIEHLLSLPDTNVLFVSNHQTYYADVIGIFHVFSAAGWKMKHVNNPLYLLWPRVNSYYIAAEETMNESGWLPKLFAYAGAVTVRRAWRHKGAEVKRNSDIKAPAKIKKALQDGWVINFPQGTTSLNAPVRKGTSNIIKALKPIVVPIEIDGFRKAFGKKGLSFKNKGTQLSIKVGAPVQFDQQVDLAEIQKYLEGKLLK